MIGNGFDLACGMNTRFTDVYESYINARKFESGNNLSRFTSILTNNHLKWKDFEMSIPELGNALGDWHSFYECMTDFTLFLDDYLTEEEQRFQKELYTPKISTVLQSSLFQPYKYCLPSSEIYLMDKINRVQGENVYNFITFNYTKTLEVCFTTQTPTLPSRTQGRNYKDSVNRKVLHLHSTLGNGILLGMDNADQYKTLPFFNEPRLKNLINKIQLNSQTNNRIEQAKDLIGKSGIIVIYGWSLGPSDLTWVNFLRETLNGNKNVDVVYAPHYEIPSNIKIAGECANREEEWRNYIIKALGLKPSDGTRVHIIVEDSFMNLPKLTTV